MKLLLKNIVYREYLSTEKWIRSNFFQEQPKNTVFHFFHIFTTYIISFTQIDVYSNHPHSLSIFIYNVLSFQIFDKIHYFTNIQ